jgi:hypothetical protein
MIWGHMNQPNRPVRRTADPADHQLGVWAALHSSVHHGRIVREASASTVEPPHPLLRPSWRGEESTDHGGVVASGDGRGGGATRRGCHATVFEGWVQRVQGSPCSLNKDSHNAMFRSVVLRGAALSRGLHTTVGLRAEEAVASKHTTEKFLAQWRATAPPQLEPPILPSNIPAFAAASAAEIPATIPEKLTFTFYMPHSKEMSNEKVRRRCPIEMSSGFTVREPRWAPTQSVYIAWFPWCGAICIGYRPSNPSLRTCRVWRHGRPCISVLFAHRQMHRVVTACAPVDLDPFPPLTDWTLVIQRLAQAVAYRPSPTQHCRLCLMGWNMLSLTQR